MKQLKFKEVEYKPKLSKEYSVGTYNKYDDETQYIRISEGCPNNCSYCFETKVNGSKPIYYKIPNIVRNRVKILDMNLIYKPDALKIIRYLGKQRAYNRVVLYELICGVDYRFLTSEIAIALKKARFKDIRIAWDHKITEQKRIKKAIGNLLSAGYRKEELTIFMICNHNVASYKDNCFKLDLAKVWGVKCADCYFDNQLAPDIKPIHWDIDEIKKFRSKVRKHNQLINFKIDPELKI